MFASFEFRNLPIQMLRVKPSILNVFVALLYSLLSVIRPSYPNAFGRYVDKLIKGVRVTFQTCIPPLKISICCTAFVKSYQTV